MGRGKKQIEKNEKGIKVSQEEGKKSKGKRARKMERRVRGKGQAQADIDRGANERT